MPRAPFAVTSALIVACPPWDARKPWRERGCGARKGEHCFDMHCEGRGNARHVIKATRAKCHPIRRRLADEQRTREVMEARKS